MYKVKEGQEEMVRRLRGKNAELGNALYWEQTSALQVEDNNGYNTPKHTICTFSTTPSTLYNLSLNYSY